MYFVLCNLTFRTVQLWGHGNETTLCIIAPAPSCRDPLVIGGFPPKCQVIQNVDVSFVIATNKLLNKQPSCEKWDILAPM